MTTQSRIELLEEAVAIEKAVKGVQCRGIPARHQQCRGRKADNHGTALLMPGALTAARRHFVRRG